MKKFIVSAVCVAMAFGAAAESNRVVVTMADGTQHVYPTENVKDITFNDTPDYINLYELVSAYYSATETSGQYVLTVGNGEPDTMGEPASVGDMQLVLCMTGPVSEDSQNAFLAPGTYAAGNGSELFTFDLSKSAVYVRTAAGSDGVEIMPLLAGNVRVAYSQGDYDVKACVTTLQGGAMDFYFNGPVGFEATLGESGNFTEDVNVTFEGGQMRYYGNWYYPFADDGTVQLYSGTFDENNSMIDGYWFQIDLNMPKQVDPRSQTITIPDGVYTVEPREKVQYSTFLPFTYNRGEIMDLWGMKEPSHTYLTHKDKSGVTRLGLVTAGTITVSGNGSKIVCDLEFDNGKKFTASYDGKVSVVNFYDTDEPEYFDIESDLVLDFGSDAVCLSYNDGGTIRPDLNTYLVMIAEPALETGDYLQLYLLTDKDELADGIYTISDDLQNFNAVRGILDGGRSIQYSWYGDLDSTDSEGYQDVLAALTGGTIKVTTINGSKRRFEFDMTTKGGKKITGSYEGIYIDATDLPTEEAPAAKSLRHRK